MVAKKEGVSEGWSGGVGLTDANYYTQGQARQVPAVEHRDHSQYPVTSYNGNCMKKNIQIIHTYICINEPL